MKNLLPHECPLVLHVLSSFKRHYGEYTPEKKEKKQIKMDNSFTLLRKKTPNPSAKNLLNRSTSVRSKQKLKTPITRNAAKQRTPTKRS